MVSFSFIKLVCKCTLNSPSNDISDQNETNINMKYASFYSNLIFIFFMGNGNTPFKVSSDTPRPKPFSKPGICGSNSVLTPRSFN